MYIYNIAFHFYTTHRITSKRYTYIQLEKAGTSDILKQKLKLKKSNTNKSNKDIKIIKQLQKRIIDTVKIEKILTVENRWTRIFDTVIDKKSRKKDVITFKNTYANKDGNILDEFKINLLKSLNDDKQRKIGIIIENGLNNLQKFKLEQKILHRKY